MYDVPRDAVPAEALEVLGSCHIIYKRSVWPHRQENQLHCKFQCMGLDLASKTFSRSTALAKGKLPGVSIQ